MPADAKMRVKLPGLAPERPSGKVSLQARPKVREEQEQPSQSSVINRRYPQLQAAAPNEREQKFGSLS